MHTPASPRYPATDSAKDRLIDQLRQQLADECRQNAQLRAQLLAEHDLLCTPNQKFSKTECVVAIFLDLFLREREGHAPTPDGLIRVPVKALAQRVGLSEDSTSSAIIKWAARGAVERRYIPGSKTEPAEVRLRRLVPLQGLPHLTCPEERNHGGARPPVVCGACGPTTPVRAEQRTTTRYLCTGCGEVLDEETRRRERTLIADHPGQTDAADEAGADPSTPPTVATGGYPQLAGTGYQTNEGGAPQAAGGPPRPPSCVIQHRCCSPGTIG